jgi:hypothetical protein
MKTIPIVKIVLRRKKKKEKDKLNQKIKTRKIEVLLHLMKLVKTPNP